MMGIGGVCKDCNERYPACHDYCERYFEAQEKWRALNEKIRAIKHDEYEMHKCEVIRKQRRRKK